MDATGQDMLQMYGKLGSALIGDFSSLLVMDESAESSQSSGDGKWVVPKLAQLDCCKFLEAILGEHMDWNIAFNGSLLHMALTLERIAGQQQPDRFEENVMEILLYFCSNVNRIHRDLVTHTSDVDKFLVAFLAFQEQRPSPITRDSFDSIHWHCLRTNVTPNAAVFGPGTTLYYAAPSASRQWSPSCTNRSSWTPRSNTAHLSL